MLTIRKLSIDDETDVYAMLQEMPADENGFQNPMSGKTYEEYKSWLAKQVASSEQTEIIDGWKVPQTTFWFFEDDIPVGYGKLRHFLTDRLMVDGGNIGYSIRPSARGRGLGKVLVAMLIEESRKIGMEKLLFTIKSHNIASLRVALVNGGTVERQDEEKYYIGLEL